MLIPLNNNLQKLINRNLSNSNVNLLLTKYVNYWVKQNNNWELEGEDRQGTRGKTGFLNRSIGIIQNQNKDYYKDYFKRYSLMLSSIKAETISGKVQWRLVVGLGSGSVLETSMTLHHILGVPYIPGTALKGVVSSYYIENNRESLATKMQNINQKRKEENKKEYKSLEEYAMNEDDIYIKLFGNENQKGKVTFLDAYPTEFPILEMDIMNPHFGDYYDGKTPPADWLSPNPIKFLTVKKDTEFIFAFKTDEDSLIETVKVLIKGSLENSGIGAKTSVGYGYFKDFQE